MTRGRVDVVAFVLLLVALLLAARFGPDPRPRTAAAATVSAETYQGKGLMWWARHAVQARKDANARAVVISRLRRSKLRRFEPPYEHAARLAAIAYGVDAGTLIRKGRCESVRWTQFRNLSSGAVGPWQFLRSTWASTPFAAFSPFDPDAAALAAAWMHRMGRGSEWSCR